MKIVSRLLAGIGLVVVIVAAAANIYAAVGDGDYRIRMLVYSGTTKPTCATSTAVGELCVNGDIETNANLDVAGTAALTGAITTGAITTTGTITGSNAGVISNATNNSWIISENSESLSCDFTSNAITLTSSTGVVSFDFGTVLPKSSATTDLGWAVTSGANTACNTTCTSACVFGWDGTNIVACTDATADKCLCAGAS